MGKPRMYRKLVNSWLVGKPDKSLPGFHFSGYRVYQESGDKFRATDKPDWLFQQARRENH